MTAQTPDAARRAFEAHGTIEWTDGAWTVTTTPFDAIVQASETDGPALTYALTVTLPTLNGAAKETVGSAVERGWLDTLERRLASAPSSTRTTVELDEYAVERVDDTVTVTYEFTLGDADTAAAVAKTFVEFVEGTYVQGVIPGYEYTPPVSTLLGEAQQSDGGPGGTPL